MLRHIVNKTAQRRFLTDQSRRMASTFGQSQPPRPPRKCTTCEELITGFLIVGGVYGTGEFVYKKLLFPKNKK